MGGSPFGPPECAAHAVKHGMNAPIRSPWEAPPGGSVPCGRPGARKRPSGHPPRPATPGGSDFEVSVRGTPPGQPDPLRGRRRSSGTSSGTSTGPQVRNSCHASEKWSLRAPFSPARRRRTATACTRLCMARLALSIRGHGGPGRLRQRWGEPPPVCALQRWAISGTPSSPRAPARRAHTAAARPRLYGAHLAPPGGQCGGPGWLRQRWGEISPGARTVHCRPRCGLSSPPRACARRARTATPYT